MKTFELEPWLKAHSSKVVSIGSELVFTHPNGGTSVLLPRDRWQDGLLPIAEPLASFYGQYFGASIGNSYLTFATNYPGGLKVSHGFKLLDFDQMAAQTHSLGIRVGEAETVFLAEAAWMFVYTIGTTENRPFLKKYDRDFGTSAIVPDLGSVLDSWWEVVNQSV
jgi:hypothetical protein